MACAHSRGASCRRIVTASPGSITWLDAASSSGSAIDSNCSRSDDDVLVADIVSGTGVRALENRPRLHHAADWRRGSSTSTPMAPARRGPSTTSPLAPFDTPFLQATKCDLRLSLAGLAGNARTDASCAASRVSPPPGKFGCLRCRTKTPRRVVPLCSRIFSLVLWWTENRLFSPDPRGAPGCSCTGCSRCSCGCQLQSTADDCESKPRACRDGIPGL